MRFSAFLLFFLMAVLGAAQTTPRKPPVCHTLDGRVLRRPAIDKLVQQLMDSAKVPGLAVALLEDNKVRYLRTYGYRNVALGAPLGRYTAMYAASFSKAVFAYLVMQLVQEKLVDLDRPL